LLELQTEAIDGLGKIEQSVPKTAPPELISEVERLQKVYQEAGQYPQVIYVRLKNTEGILLFTKWDGVAGPKVWASERTDLVEAFETVLRRHSEKKLKRVTEAAQKASKEVPATLVAPTQNKSTGDGKEASYKYPHLMGEGGSWAGTEVRS
jgi:hypothetical protein